MIDNIILSIKKDDRYKECLKSIPDSVLSKFIYGLFEGGRHDVGNGLKIIDAYTNNNGGNSPASLFCNENLTSFVEHGLVEEKENRITGKKYYEVSGKSIGHSVWLFANKKERKVYPSSGFIEEKINPEIDRVRKKYKGIPTRELQKRREDLNERRRKMMLQVARARAAGRGNYTSVNVKEGSAERFASIVSEYDVALDDRNLEI